MKRPYPPSSDGPALPRVVNDTPPMKRNALFGFPPAVPSIDGEIKRLVARHGADAVRDAVKRHAKKKTGPKKRTNWEYISPFLKGDAIALVEGRDPFKSPANNKIAREYSKQFPGQDQVSTHRRVMQDLKDYRHFIAWIRAEDICRNHCPNGEYLDLLGRMPKDHESLGPFLSSWALKAKKVLDNYRRKIGEVPHALSILEVEAHESMFEEPRQSFLDYLLEKAKKEHE